MFQLSRCILISLFAFALQAYAAQDGATASSTECTEELGAILEKFSSDPSKAGLYVDQIILNDRPSFASLIDPNPEKNLFARAPLIAMNAGQRNLAMVLSQGVEFKKNGFLIEPVNFYPFFTNGKVTQGYRIEGNWKPVHELMTSMIAQSEGDRSGRIVPVLFGPGGTGKSEARTVLEKGSEFLTTNQSDYFVYTYDWVGMNQIPEMVKRWGPDVDVIPAPNKASPITILPPQFQKQALQMAKIKGQAMLHGRIPEIKLDPPSWSRTILQFVIDHYTRLNGGPMTMSQTIQAIAKHVQVRRYVVSAAYRQFPIVNVQGIDANANNLMVASNPVVQAISPEQKMDPFAYSYSGLFYQAMNNVLVLEEATRSHPTFLEKIMDGLESRELQADGAAKEPWDAFIIAISNKESYDALMAKGGLGALKQRFKLIDMVQPSQPQLIVRTILYGVKDNLFMKEIGKEDAQWVKGDPDKLYPIPERLEPGHVIGPERRYLMRLGEGENAVEISPHTLRFMAHIVAATRFETDTQKAYQLVQSRLVADNLFTDPIQRIRFWDGKLTDVTPEERRTLEEMTNKLQEGHEGIFHRAILQWLTTAVQKVRSDSRLGKTLTPSVVLQVFEEEGFRSDGFLKLNDPKLATHYKNLGRLVLKELLIPTVREDINLAYSSDQGSISEIYEDVLEELYATEPDPATGKAPEVTTYTSQRTQRVAKINKERTQFIRDFYKKKTGRDLPMGQILWFHRNQKQDGGAKAGGQAPEITSALAAYMAKKTLEAANATGLADAIRNGTGSKETLELVNNLLKQMEKLGYNGAAALDAFDLEHSASQATQTADTPAAP